MITPAPQDLPQLPPPPRPPTLLNESLSRIGGFALGLFWTFFAQWASFAFIGTFLTGSVFEVVALLIQVVLYAAAILFAMMVLRQHSPGVAHGLIAAILIIGGVLVFLSASWLISYVYFPFWK